MFTGIITNIATIKNIEFNENKDCLIAIKIDDENNRELKIGCSISNNGVCLTLIKKESDLLFFQASKESCDITTIKNWQINDKINIEFALRVGDEFGGHIVSGHVDDVAKLIEITEIQESKKMKFKLKNHDLMRYIAKKGSISIDGISLTVNEVFDDSFEVNIINHTFENTNLKYKNIDDEFNIEIDLLARYVNKANK